MSAPCILHWHRPSPRPKPNRLFPHSPRPCEDCLKWSNFVNDAKAEWGRTIRQTSTKYIAGHNFQPRELDTRGHVYAITHPSFCGWIKIGSTVDLQKRLSSYQTGDPLRRYKMIFHIEVDHRLAVERWFRHCLNNHEQRGEWVSCDVDTFMKSLDEILLLINIDNIGNLVV